MLFAFNKVRFSCDKAQIFNNMSAIQFGLDELLLYEAFEPFLSISSGTTSGVCSVFILAVFYHDSCNTDD